MQSEDFDSALKREWDELYLNRGKNGLFRNDLEKRLVKDLGDNLRVIFIDGFAETKRKTQFTFDSGKGTKVYEEYDESKFNFNKIKDNEILFYINFDEEEVVTRERKAALDSENLEEALEQEISQTTLHPVILNPSPILQRHCVIVPFCEEELPQVIGTEMISTVLQIFKLASSPDLRIGFNSTGGFSSVNHLHFQCLYLEEFMEKRKFPVELAKRSLIHSTSLINPKDEINMYSVGVKISELTEYLVRGLVITPSREDAELHDIFNSIAFVAGTITNMLLEKEIPHNILISDGGKTFYIFPRKHSSVSKSKYIALAWIELSGLILCWDKETYEKLDLKTLQKISSDDTSLEKEDFESLKKEIIGLFSSTFLPE